MTRPLTGCGTALVTPFTREGRVDEPSLRALVEWQIAEGIHFLVPCGSTGEAATMSVEEQRRVVEITAEVANGRLPVVAGAGSNDTARAIALSREMVASGATHLLHVSPAYNKPPQRGIVAHFRAIADAAERPVVTEQVALSDDFIKRLRTQLVGQRGVGDRYVFVDSEEIGHSRSVSRSRRTEWSARRAG